MERIRNEILSNPELAKMLLQPDNGEKVFIGGQCKDNNLPPACKSKICPMRRENRGTEVQRGKVN